MSPLSLSPSLSLSSVYQQLFSLGVLKGVKNFLHFTFDSIFRPVATAPRGGEVWSLALFAKSAWWDEKQKYVTGRKSVCNLNKKYILFLFAYSVLHDVASCGQVGNPSWLLITGCVQFKGRLLPWRLKQKVPPTSLLFTRIYGVTFQNIVD